jgi:uncharacterized membrane protein YfcA
MFWQLWSTLDWGQLSILILSALLIGINKTAVPGIGVLPVVLLALWFEPRLSAGLQLVMLAMTDVMAVAYYRRHADWGVVLRLLPWAVGGLALGHFALDWISDDFMRPVLGGIILFLCILRQVYKRVSPDKIPSGSVIAGVCGLLLGFTTMVANAAGPVAAIYFLAMKLPKDKYMGCSAWFFLLINWTKLPVFWYQGRITQESFLLDLTMLPFLVLGAAAGIWLLPKIPQKLFENIIEVLIVITALKLFF